MSGVEQNTSTAVLVVDDDRTIANLLSELLTDEGYTVHTAYSVQQALLRIGQHELDVVLLDVQLPDGNGFELCAQLRNNPATVDLPVLLMSAVGRNSAFVAYGLDLGGYDFMPKPFNNIELLARIRVLVRLRKLQQRLIEQERERAMLATAGAAAHNLAQPLMAALGLVNLVLQTELTVTQRQDIEQVHVALKQMSTIMRQIQDVQRYTTQPYLDGNANIEILDLEQASIQRLDGEA